MSVAKTAFVVIFVFSVGITLLMAGFPPAQIIREYLGIPEMASSIWGIPLTSILDGITNGFFWVLVGGIIYGLAHQGRKVQPLLPMPVPPRLATPLLENTVVDYRTSTVPPAFTFTIPSSFGSELDAEYLGHRRSTPSRGKVWRIHEVVTVRGHSRSCFRDPDTGRFVKKLV